MDYQRIESSIDIAKMQKSHATIIGGGYGLAHDLVRCGIGSILLMDFDKVSASNPARQDLDSTDIGRCKVEAVADALRRINPQVEVNYLRRDFCELTDPEINLHLGHSHLFVFATDFFPAQAHGNQVAIRLGIPSVWIGMYREGRAGEIIYTMPGVTQACFRCICSTRYQSFFEQAGKPINDTMISSSGATIMDLHLVDAIASQIAVGLLTHGSDNRMGRLIGQLGNRNILQVKSDPLYKLGQNDLFTRVLGDHPANFSFTTIAMPMEPELDCPDCASLRSKDDTCRKDDRCVKSIDETSPTILQAASCSDELND